MRPPDPTPDDVQTDSASSPDEAEEPEDDSDDPGDGDASAFCGRIAQLQAELDDPTDDADVGVLLESMQESVERLSALEAPTEIAADWAAIIRAFESFAEAAEGIDLSGPEQSVEQMEDLLKEFDESTAALEEASSRVDAYVREECGISLD
ncbi:MAG: hypothetical protein ACRDWI_14430 [Jiangellaceae bacterium]